MVGATALNLKFSSAGQGAWGGKFRSGTLSVRTRFFFFKNINSISKFGFKEIKFFIKIEINQFSSLKLFCLIGSKYPGGINALKKCHQFLS